MKLRIVLPLAVSALALAAPAVAAAPTIAAKTPVGTLNAEDTAFNSSNWKAVWSAYTPTYQSKCGPFSTFAKNLTKTRKQVGMLSTKITGVKISGSTAKLAYQLIAGGKVLATVKASSPDVYVKTHGLWYDEYEPAHGC
jgi:hypothetical protein